MQRTRPRRSLWGWCLAVVLLWSLGTPAALFAEPDFIAIGGLWDLSGPRAPEGSASLLGARCAVEAVNQKGGIQGRRLVLLIGDTRGRTGPLLLGAQKLIESERVVALLGPTDPELDTTAAAKAQYHQVPLVLTAGDSLLLPSASGLPVDYTFGVSVPLGPQIKMLYRALKAAGLDTVAPLVPDNEEGRKVTLWLRAYGPELGVRVLSPRAFHPGDSDMVAQLQEIKDRGAVAVFWGPRSEIPTLVRSDATVKAPLATFAGLISEQFMGGGPPDTRMWVVAPPLALRDQIPSNHACAPANRRFLAALGPQAASLSMEELMAAGRAWDGVNLLVLAISRAGNSRSGVRDALETLTEPYVGVMGVQLPTEGDHAGLDPNSLVVLQKTGQVWKPAPLTP